MMGGFAVVVDCSETISPSSSLSSHFHCRCRCHRYRHYHRHRHRPCHRLGAASWKRLDTVAVGTPALELWSDPCCLGPVARLVQDDTKSRTPSGCLSPHRSGSNSLAVGSTFSCALALISTETFVLICGFLEHETNPKTHGPRVWAEPLSQPTVVAKFSNQPAGRCAEARGSCCQPL